MGVIVVLAPALMAGLLAIVGVYITTRTTVNTVRDTTQTTREVAEETRKVARETLHATVAFNREATRQKEDAAKREEWWRRFEWAAQLSMDESSAVKARGLRLLLILRHSPLAGPDEQGLMYAFITGYNADLIRRATEGGH